MKQNGSPSAICENDEQNTFFDHLAFVSLVVFLCSLCLFLSSNTTKIKDQSQKYFSRLSRKQLIFTIFLENLLQLNLSDFIKERLSFESYAFNWDELLIAKADKSQTSIQSQLSYAIQKGDIIPLRHHFYLIIPPRYSKFGKLPIELYVNSLFEFLDRNYYIGLYSAARSYGAGHQQIQKEYVFHDKAPLLSISKNSINLDFFTVSNWPTKNIVSKKGDAGMYNISSPCLTAVDLIYHQTKIGGLNRMLSVLEELTEEMKMEDAKDLLSWYSQKSVLQRLGFLLDEINLESDIANLIYEHLKLKKFYPVLLSPRSNEKAGAVENRWKIDVNIKMESDL